MPTLRKWATAIATSLALLSALSHAAERPPVADKVVAYSGEKGTKVWTLRIGERSANEALVQVGGIDHDWDMRIQKMTVEKTAKDTRYSTTVDGHKFVVLILQNSWGTLYLPNEAQEITVGYDENLSNQGDAQAFLTDYLQAE